MLQVGAAGHHLEHGVVGDVVTAGDLQAAQLRAALSHHVQPAVGQLLAAVDHHRLQSQAHVRGVLAQPVGQDPDGAVGVKQLAREPDAAPQPRVPRHVVPAAAHPSAAAQLIGGEVGEDLEQDAVREQVDGQVVVAFGRAGARVSAGLRVDDGHCLAMSGGGGGGVGFMAVAGKGRRGERGRLGRQDETRTGGAQCPRTRIQT